MDDSKSHKQSPAGSGWTFLSNHAHVLLCIAREPDSRLRDVADKVGITERAVQRIVADLEGGGYLTRGRSGRRNSYEVHPDRPLRHPIEAHRDVRQLLALVLSPEELRDMPSATAGGTRIGGGSRRFDPPGENHGPSPG